MNHYRQPFSFLILLLAVFLFSCESDPKSHEAVVSDAAKISTENLPGEKFKLDSTSSQITWVGTKPTGRHHGLIAISAGIIAVENENVAGGHIIIDMNEIYLTDLPTNSPDYSKLLTHLKSEDFFDVSKFPHAVFQFNNVQPYVETGDSLEVDQQFAITSPSHLISGNLTMKGKTQQISFPAKVLITDGALYAEAKFNIDRTLWGVSYNEEAKFINKAKDGLIYDKVNVGFSIVAKQEANL